MSRGTLKNIALVAGGYSGEYEVSINSQKALLQFLSASPYRVIPVLVRKDGWGAEFEGAQYGIDKNDFSFTTKSGEKIQFEYAYITIHGTPGENGLFTGYLDMLDIPYSCCPTLIGALTFNKFTCNHYLSSFGVKVARSILLRAGEPYSTGEIVDQGILPAFVKPNVGGSSIATTKVTRAEQLQSAIDLAFGAGDQVIIERLITGTEVTCGAYRDASGIHTLPVTEVVPKNEFFDYDAKYNGAVDEITPARISDEMTERIQSMTKDIYGYLNAEGIIRVDYIIEDGEPILLEVNTTPGMTGTSFIPQQVRAANLNIGKVLEGIIEYQWSKSKK